jgi:uncharacterized protein
MSDDTRATIESIEIVTNGRESDFDQSTPASSAHDLTQLQEFFADYIDTATKAIGRVVGSEREPSGAHQFFFWASDDAVSLDVGHIVVAFSEQAAVVGVVDEPRRYSDLQSFLDDYYDRHVEIALADDLPTKRPEILVFAVNVLATKHIRKDVDSHRPPVAGSVYYATKEAIAFALDTDGFTGAAIPALMHTNGNAERNDDGNELRDELDNVVFQQAPIWLDEDYLLGPEAGHANWTGQSGLATKTSHALFLTSAVFQTMQREGKSVAALMFNVKGADLLWLDKPAIPTSPELAEAYKAAGFNGLSERDRQAYEALGIEPAAFDNLRIFAPFKPSQEPRASKGTSSGIVNLGEYKDRTTLNTLRSNESQVSCVYPILFQLGDLLYQPHKVFEYNDLDDKFFGFISYVREQDIQSIHQLNAHLATIEQYFEANPSETDWQGHHKLTIRKARNRFDGLVSKFAGLLTDGTVDYGSLPRVDTQFSNQEVRVIDIAHCNSNVQEMLVTKIVHQLWRMAERDELGVDKVIIFVDELNKYAPGGGQGALRDTLVDIAARGRHLNVVLFGAQQFRSKVDDEILGNCGTSLYGRIGDEEIVNSAYRALSNTAKNELLGLRKGRLLVRHAHFRAPLFGSFPMPPTVPGQIGSRVFNSGKSGIVVINTAGDGLYMMLRRHMPSGCPSKNEVLTEVAHLDAERIVWITQTTEQEWLKKKGTSAEARVTSWIIAKNLIRSATR